MKKMKHLFLLAVMCMAIFCLAGCGDKKDDDTKSTAEATTAAPATEVKTEEGTTAAKTEEPVTEEPTSEVKVEDDVTIRVGSLKGPTTIGLAHLMKASDEGASLGKYSFTIAAQADEVTSKLVSGDLDIALIPANAAAVLYNKTQGKIKVIDINTLGVLYCVSGNGDIKSVENLAGKKVISMGQGTTPEYMLKYLLDKAGITDCEIVFVSEATEAAALLAEDPSGIAVLPQPFVTAALKQNDQLAVAFSLTDEWERLSGGNALVTGVTVVRADFLAEHEEAVKLFMSEQKESTEKLSTDLDGAAEIVVEKGIIEKAPIAKAAIPNCNIKFIAGEEMKTNVSEYLKVLYDLAPESVGKKLPEDDFYYTEFK